MLFGEYLVSRGKLKSKDVEGILHIQKKSAVPIGKLAAEKKFLTLADVFTIRAHQKTTGNRFGEVAVNLDLLKPRQVDTLLDLQNVLRPFFGELLVQNNMITQEEFLEELRAFRATLGKQPGTLVSRIAIIDVEPARLFAMYNALTRMGYEVFPEPFSPDVVRRLMEERPQFVIVDLSSKKDDKLRALERARAEHPMDEVKILALVDKLAPADRERAQNAGIAEFAPASALAENIAQFVHGTLASAEKEKAGTVLLVDDSHTVLRLMSFFLEQERYETYLAATAEEAQALLEKVSPDLVLTDLHLPGMNGIELCRAVKQNPKTRDVPVVLVTTAKAITRLKEALDSGASDYIVKPFQQDELLARVRSHIKTKRLIDELQRSRKELLVSNEKLAEANNKKTEFLATVAHDLRTPLTSIRTYSELLGMKNTPIDAQKEFVQIIQSEAIRMAGLIKNYLDISRLESTAASHRKEEFDLAQMVEYFAKIYSTMAKNKQVKFKSSVAKGVVTLMGDKEQFEQVLSNLLDNAVKFTPAQGLITLGLTVAEKGARRFAEITVGDSGKGIPKDAQQYLFKKFHYLHNEYQPIKGTGLGLAICKEIVERHGGKIDVDSEEGKGATFRVIVPLLATEKPKAEKPKGKRKR
ncbi:MAG: response regulator [Nitrospinae bacterium]|nr:response regulator [Nitrospinota bacterium]